MSKRGFAGMDPERRRELAKKGGERARDLGTGHRFSTEEAKAAGRKGGLTRGQRLREKHAVPQTETEATSVLVGVLEERAGES